MKKPSYCFLLLFLILPLVSSVHVSAMMEREKAEKEKTKTALNFSKEQEKEALIEEREAIGNPALAATEFIEVERVELNSNQQETATSSTESFQQLENLEQLEENLTTLPILQQQLQEVQQLAEDLNKTDPAIGQVKLQQLFKTWFQRYERYQQALQIVSLDKNFDQTKEKTLKLLEKLVNLSREVVEELEGALEKTSEQETTRINNGVLAVLTGENEKQGAAVSKTKSQSLLPSWHVVTQEIKKAKTPWEASSQHNRNAIPRQMQFQKTQKEQTNIFTLQTFEAALKVPFFLLGNNVPSLLLKKKSYGISSKNFFSLIQRLSATSFSKNCSQNLTYEYSQHRTNPFTKNFARLPVQPQIKLLPAPSFSVFQKQSSQEQLLLPRASYQYSHEQEQRGRFSWKSSFNPGLIGIGTLVLGTRAIQDYNEQTTSENISLQKSSLLFTSRFQKSLFSFCEASPWSEELEANRRKDLEEQLKKAAETQDIFFQALQKESPVLSDDLFEKKKAAEAASQQFVTSCEQALASLKKLPLQDKKELEKNIQFWTNQLAEAKNQKNWIIWATAQLEDAIAATDAELAVQKADQAPLEERAALYEQALQKQKGLEIPSQQVVTTCEQALASLKEFPLQDKKKLEKNIQFWNDELAEAKNQKNKIPWRTAQLEGAITVPDAELAAQKADQAPLEERAALYEQALPKHKDVETALQKVVTTCEQALASLKEFPLQDKKELEKAIQFWTNQLAKAKNQKNKILRRTARLESAIANAYARLAAQKADQAPLEERAALYEKALQKYKDVKTALQKVVKVCKEALTSLKEFPLQDQKQLEEATQFWNNQLAETKNQKNQSTLAAALLESAIAVTDAKLAAQKADQAPLEERAALYEQALQKQKGQEIASEQVVTTCEQALVSLKEFPLQDKKELEEATQFWTNKLAEAKNQKNKMSWQAARLEISIADAYARLAAQKADQAPLEERVALLEQTLQKQKDAETAWQKIVTTCEQALVSLKEFPLQDKKELEEATQFWNDELVRAKNQKNQRTWVTARLEGAIVENDAKLAVQKADQAPLEERAALYEQALQKQKGLETPPQQVIQKDLEIPSQQVITACEQALASLKEFIQKGLEIPPQQVAQKDLEISSQQVVTTCEQALASLKEFPLQDKKELEEATQFWNDELVRAKKQKNQRTLLTAQLEGAIAATNAKLAVQKADQAPLEERAALYEQALQKHKDVETAVQKVVKVCKEALTSLKEFPLQDQKQLEEATQLWKEILEITTFETSLITNGYAFYQAITEDEQSLLSEKEKETISRDFSQPEERAKKLKNAQRKKKTENIQNRFNAYVKNLKEFQETVEQYQQKIKGNSKEAANERSRCEQLLQEITKSKEDWMFKIISSLDFSTEKDKAVLWTGYDEKVQEQAMKHASKHGKKTIEQTEGGSLLHASKLYDIDESPFTADVADLLWKTASKKFAEGMRGEVHVFLPSKKPRLGSAFESTEKPIVLKENPHVTLVTEHIKSKTNWRTWENEGEQREGLYSIFDPAIRLQHTPWSPDLMQADAFHQEAQDAAKKAFQFIDRAEQAAHPKIALSYWELAIETASATEKLFDKTLHFFERGKEQTPQQFTEEKSLNRIKELVERNRNDWKTGAQWCIMKRESERANELQQRIENLHLNLSKIEIIKNLSNELETSIEGSQRAAAEWRRLQQEFLPNHPDAKTESTFIDNKTRLYGYKTAVTLTALESLGSFQEAIRVEKEGASLWSKLAEFFNINTPQKNLTNYSKAARAHDTFLKECEKQTKGNDIEARLEWNHAKKTIEKLQEDFAHQLITGLDFKTEKNQVLFNFAFDQAGSQKEEELRTNNQGLKTYSETPGGRLLKKTISYDEQSIHADVVDKLTTAALEQTAKHAQGTVRVILPADMLVDSKTSNSLYKTKIKPILESNPLVTEIKEEKAEDTIHRPLGLILNKASSMTNKN